MLRLVGFWLGVALTALGLIYAVDPPQAARLGRTLGARVGEVVEQLTGPADLAGSSHRRAALPSPKAAAVLAVLLPEETPGATDRPALPERESALTATPVAAPKPLPAKSPPTATGGPAPAVGEPPAPAADPGDPARDPEPPPGAAYRSWYTFWGPFHSAVSARGFADRLTMLTGLDLRVTGDGPGRYRVAFAYSDEKGKQAAMAAIEAGSGLRLEQEAP